MIYIYIYIYHIIYTPGAPGPPTTKILQRPQITRVEKKGVSIGGKPVPGLKKLGRRLFQNLSIYM